LDFEDVGFAFVGVGGDSKNGGAGGGGVEDEGDGLAFGIVAGQGDRPGPFSFRPRPPGEDSAVSGPIVQADEQGVGAVDLVAGGTEVLAMGPSSVPRATRYCMSWAACSWSG
jgi:hypothetical protein